jgi:hypothetical protein
MGNTDTPEGKRIAFLAELRASANVSAGARAAGVYRKTVYDWRADPEFAKAWDDALEEATDELEEAARQRAMGYKRDVWFQGQCVGETTEYSDAMTALLLKAHRPDKFSDRHAIEMSGQQGKPLEIVHYDVSGLDEDERDELQKLAQKALQKRPGPPPPEG